MKAEIFEDICDLLYRLRDYEREHILEAIKICRETGGPCAIADAGIMVHTKNYFGNVFYGLVTDVTEDNLKYVEWEISEALMNAKPAERPIKKTA